MRFWWNAVMGSLSRCPGMWPWPVLSCRQKIPKSFEDATRCFCYGFWRTLCHRPHLALPIPQGTTACQPEILCTATAAAIQSTDATSCMPDIIRGFKALTEHVTRSALATRLLTCQAVRAVRGTPAASSNARLLGIDAKLLTGAAMYSA